MKKLVLVLLTTAFFTAGAAFAQQDSHDVNIKLPNVLQLRITDGTGTDAATSPAVEFDYQTLAANVDTYINTVNGGGGDLVPTTTTDFGDVIVFANRGSWSVSVDATAIAFNDNLGLTVAGAGVALSDISVARGAVSGLSTGTGVSSVSASWDLSGSQIASGVKTTGWSSLGFNGSDYLFSVDGDEDPGEYTTVVTYSITAP